MQQAGGGDGAAATAAAGTPRKLRELLGAVLRRPPAPASPSGIAAGRAKQTAKDPAFDAAREQLVCSARADSDVSDNGAADCSGGAGGGSSSSLAQSAVLRRHRSGRQRIGDSADLPLNMSPRDAKKELAAVAAVAADTDAAARPKGERREEGVGPPSSAPAAVIEELPFLAPSGGGPAAPRFVDNGPFAAAARAPQCASSPSGGGGGSSTATFRCIKPQGGKLCGSADDLYNAIFGDAPLLAPPQQQQQQQQQQASLPPSPLQRRGTSRLSLTASLLDGVQAAAGVPAAAPVAAQAAAAAAAQWPPPLPVLPPIRTARRSGCDDASCDPLGDDGGPPLPAGCSSPVVGGRGGGDGGSGSGGGGGSGGPANWWGSGAGALHASDAGPAPLQRVCSLQRGAANSSFGSSAGSFGGGGGGGLGLGTSVAAPASCGGSAASISSSIAGVGVNGGGPTRSASMPGGGGHPGCARNLFGPAHPAPWPPLARSTAAPAPAPPLPPGSVSAVAAAPGGDAIREINADNVLSAAWGPPAGAAKLLGFKFSAAVSPLPLARGSPFASPRHQRALGAAAAAARAGSAEPLGGSCPGTPLGSTGSLLALCRAHAVDSLDLAASAAGGGGGAGSGSGGATRQLAPAGRSAPVPSWLSDGDARQQQQQQQQQLAGGSSGTSSAAPSPTRSSKGSRAAGALPPPLPLPPSQQHQQQASDLGARLQSSCSLSSSGGTWRSSSAANAAGGCTTCGCAGSGGGGAGSGAAPGRLIASSSGSSAGGSWSCGGGGAGQQALAVSEGDALPAGAALPQNLEVAPLVPGDEPALTEAESPRLPAADGDACAPRAWARSRSGRLLGAHPSRLSNRSSTAPAAAQPAAACNDGVASRPAAVEAVAAAAACGDEDGAAAVADADATNGPSKNNELAAPALLPATAAAATLMPPSLPEVDFIERIGRGSHGEVFKGVWNGSVVAVKVIRVCSRGGGWGGSGGGGLGSGNGTGNGGSSGGASHDDGDGGGGGHHGGGDEGTRAELARHEYESWLNANLRHPHIVQLYTSFTVALEGNGGGGGGNDAGFGAAAAAAGGGAACWKTHLIMEWADLGTLAGALAAGALSAGGAPGAPPRLCAVLATAKEVCAAVAYLHASGIVHGDLKSTNVLLRSAAATPADARGFAARVSDFGLARVLDLFDGGGGSSYDDDDDDSGEAGGDDEAAAPRAAATAAAAPPPPHRFGALTHAAPELLRGAPLTRASDVYALGVLLWELLTGRAPFRGVTAGELAALKLARPTAELLPLPDSTPPQLASLCRDCWADAPPSRPTAAAVVAALNRAALELLGPERAVAAFPDVARLVAAPNV